VEAETNQTKQTAKLGTRKLVLRRGSPLPFGASIRRNGINFAIFSRRATDVVLVLLLGDDEEPIEFRLSPQLNKTGDIWHALIRDLQPGVRYAYRLDCCPNPNPNVHCFDGGRMLLDPYAEIITGRPEWGLNAGADNAHPVGNGLRRGLVIEDDFDWGDDRPLRIPLVESVIYELHLRGFTKHGSSGVGAPGTFAGLVEKIPYLKQLGITAVELLPIYEFEETDTDRINPVSGEGLLNYWGYHPISFFAPKASYASSTELGAQVREFKAMVKAFHKAGMEVILDVVFNHTAEGDERGTTFSFRGIDNATYYIIDRETGQYHNYSGCGNTVNCNHPVVRDMVLSSLRYWVTEMHVDGFRFDLASILGRGRDGSVLPNPPLLERIAADPVLADTKLIAEAWDAAGLYQVGSFPAWRRWAEWNGRFRDDIRRFVRGDPGMASALATRLTGSADLYQTSSREPYHSINFVTCHDGFTLADLVSYNEKHNIENGEDNRDGDNHNLSWNCGTEGPSDSDDINQLRTRQMKNMATLLMLSNGVPMILAGDEMARTQRGNNNAYCQDNELSWMNWDLAEQNKDLVRFFRLLISFRRQCTGLKRKSFVPEEDDHIASLEWHGIEPFDPDWSSESRSLAMCIRATTDRGTMESVYMGANAYWEPLPVTLPTASEQTWYRVIDTMLASPRDIAEPGNEQPLEDQAHYLIGPRSVVVLLGR
jgi:glycogen operon protein